MSWRPFRLGHPVRAEAYSDRFRFEDLNSEQSQLDIVRKTSYGENEKHTPEVLYSC